ncbi:MAG: inositol monophosphatase [Bacteroidetes bacterium]|nr:inositol monophosphatase [Bacteroidota bacterium]
MSGLFENSIGGKEFSIICEEMQILSLQVGKFVSEERKKIKSLDIEHKGSSDLVSYVDKTAEKKFVEGLKKILPSAGFIAEEDHTLKKNEILNWVIDPLDGTTNYLHGVPVFATSVALLQNNIPVAGVVHEINLDECFYAWKNGGAWMNGEKICISKKTELQNSLVATGFPYEEQGWHEKYISLFSDVQRSSLGIRRPGSAATDIAYVAGGRFDAYYEYGIHAWDVAAGALLVQEAGGTVKDFSGGDDFIFGERFVCGNEKIVEELLQKIKIHFK